MPELITSTQERYEELAITLATNPDMLRCIRQKLIDNRQTTPLFNMKSFARHMEAAYLEMYEIYHRGDPPSTFAIES
jgi:predicted O-linked N-acetylglucosamine transferase (SPINDLY family)